MTHLYKKKKKYLKFTQIVHCKIKATILSLKKCHQPLYCLKPKTLVEYNRSCLVIHRSNLGNLGSKLIRVLEDSWYIEYRMCSFNNIFF